MRSRSATCWALHSLQDQTVLLGSRPGRARWWMTEATTLPGKRSVRRSRKHTSQTMVGGGLNASHTSATESADMVLSYNDQASCHLEPQIKIEQDR